jgi:hypothetical protein
MKKIMFFVTLFIALTFTSGTLYAKIVVEATKGETAFKKGNQWVQLTKGQNLEEGTKISTGAKSWVELNIDGDSLRINQLTMMKIFTNKITKNDKDTHLGLKHGSLKARIGKLGTLKTSFKITTPVATSSVRGTDEFNWQGAKSGNLVQALTGIIEVEDRNGGVHSISGNSTFRISPNDPRPKNLLSSERGKAIANISDPNTTNDEKGSQDFSGLETLNSNDNPALVSPPAQSPATVNLQIQW